MKITTPRPQNCVSINFGKFVLKIAPNRRAKFGGIDNSLYLCIVNRWSSESHQACLRSTSGRLLPQGRKNGRVATEKDAVNHEGSAQPE